MMVPAGSQCPAGGPGTDNLQSAMRTISSRTMRKSSPPQEEKAPGTFSQMIHLGLGRTARAVPPFPASASLISFMIRIISMKRPERSPDKPERGPATDRSWQGEPPEMMSTGGSSAPLSFVMSPSWSILGKWAAVTCMGNGSISLAHSGVIPNRDAASGNPPIPSNRLPRVKFF